MCVNFNMFIHMSLYYPKEEYKSQLRDSMNRFKNFPHTFYLNDYAK